MRLTRLPEGGVLALRTRRIDSPSQGDHGEPLSQVCIEVSDTGIGMDEETRRRCLEPFFTTKGERGTGLGLAMVYGMIQRHSAELELEERHLARVRRSAWSFCPRRPIPRSWSARPSTARAAVAHSADR